MAKVTIPQKLMVRELSYFENNLEHVYSSRKRELFSQIKRKDKVLEIGPGTGVNFKYYPRGLSLTVVEPNILLHKNLKENALKNKINLEIIKSKNRCTIGARFLNAQRAPQSKECGYRSTLTSSAEHLPFTENRFNFVVSTLVLCSVHDLKSVLVEIKRVLKKGGEYLCIEHVIDDKNYFRRIIQNIAAHSPWTFFGDYCHPNRDILGEIRNTGFSKINVKKYLQKDMGFMGWVISPHVVVCAEK